MSENKKIHGYACARAKQVVWLHDDKFVPCDLCVAIDTLPSPTPPREPEREVGARHWELRTPTGQVLVERATDPAHALVFAWARTPASENEIRDAIKAISNAWGGDPERSEYAHNGYTLSSCVIAPASAQPVAWEGVRDALMDVVHDAIHDAIGEKVDSDRVKNDVLGAMRAYVHSTPAAAPGTETDGALRTALERVRADLESALNKAYDSASLVCCGRPGEQCCGAPEQKWDDASNAIMDTLGPIHRHVIEALRAAHATAPGEVQP